MDPALLTARLASVAEQLGVEVRFEGLEEGRGGLFTFRGKLQIVVNESLPEEEKAEVLAEALIGFDLENLFLLPEIRDLIEQYRLGRA